MSTMAESDMKEFGIAIIGMSVRLPGANSVEQYWEHLVCGRETIKTFTEADLLKLGVSAAEMKDPQFVPAGSRIADGDLFAASFFGYSPREAEFMDPQHRNFLECSWEAMENAGYAPRSLRPSVGVFAGASLSTYMLFNVLGNTLVLDEESEFQAMIGGDKDFLSTRVSYKLNLKGPSVMIQCGCSSSLVAVHLAVQSLLNCECDMAIAGGVSIGVPQRIGYRYQANGLLSPDGHCRPFSAEAAGTVFGEGVGVVVLKRFEDAVRDRDNIRGVILGSAVNNDGSTKVGYTAPGLDGQAEVIARAHAVSGITADTVTYIEAHGTGTLLGDPIEVEALARVFRRSTDRKGFCGLGSVKSNVGHLDAAAGIAGLIKVVLMLEHKWLVPTLHVQAPNPNLALESGPFYLVSKVGEWKEILPRRAGVSSFGIGGTNAHVVLEEAPERIPQASRRPFYLLSVSAQTEYALAETGRRLATFLENGNDDDLRNIAYTLHTGREAFKHRRSVVCRDTPDAAQLLVDSHMDRCLTAVQSGISGVAFMFPGGGTQFCGMGQQLYEFEPRFRESIDLCAQALRPHFDLTAMLYRCSPGGDIAAKELARPSIALPTIFATEYAMAQLLMSWGIHPTSMIGHSLGEYTAACLAGVFTFQDALSLVHYRGKLFERLPSGAMLGAYLPEEQAHGFTNESVSIAAINNREQCVFSGPTSSIERLEAVLAERGIECHRLYIDVAAHSSLVEPVISDFRRFVATLKLGPPLLPFISNLTGTWITPQDCMRPDYWAAHLRETVRFSAGLAEIFSQQDLVLLEIGPSRTLSSIAKAEQPHRAGSIYASMKHPRDEASDIEVLYKALARLWNSGIAIDWRGFYKNDEHWRVPLPTYPFERKRYWIVPQNKAVARTHSRLSAQPDVYMAGWKSEPLKIDSAAPCSPARIYILLMDRFGIGESLRRRLVEKGERVVAIEIGPRFKKRLDDHYVVVPTSESDLTSVLDVLDLSAETELKVIHLWSFTAPSGSGRTRSDEVWRQSIFSFMALGKAFSRCGNLPKIELIAASNGVEQVSGADEVLPEKAPLDIIGRVISQECENVVTKVVDVCFEPDLQLAMERIAVQILEEAAAWDSATPIAYRGCRRWRRIFEPVDLAPGGPEYAGIRENGVYLMTGGLGALGPVIAHSFANQARCKLILTSRSPFPAKPEWHHWSHAGPMSEKEGRAIRTLLEIEAKGSEVVVLQADVSSKSDMNAVVNHIQLQFGKLDGVMHLAGVTGHNSLCLISDLDEGEFRRQCLPKVQGACVLEELLEPMDLDFCVLFSSTASLLGGAGMMPYAVANSFLDALAAVRNLRSEQRWITINWDAWYSEDASGILAKGKTALDRFAISTEAGLRILHRILAAGKPGQFVVSRGEMQARMDELDQGPVAGGATSPDSQCHDRPILAVDYVAPVTAMQRQIAETWADVLGVKRVGLNDNFFELGGNSLIGLRIASRLKRKLGLDVPVVSLFEGPTVLSLARIVERRIAMQDSSDGVSGHTAAKSR